MNMMRSAIAGLVMMMGGLSFAAETPYATDREGRPMLVEHVPMARFAELVERDAAGGLRWLVCVTPEGTQYDPFQMQFAIVNGSDRRIRITPVGDPNDPQRSGYYKHNGYAGLDVSVLLERIEDGTPGATRTVTLRTHHPSPMLRDTQMLRPGGWWGSGGVDLRKRFSDLPPGAYRVRVETDVVRIAPRGAEPIEQALESPWVSFEIIETSVAEAMAEMELGENDLLFEAKRSDGEGSPRWAATLGVPRSSEAMTVTADFGFRNPEEREGPANVLSCIERYNPKRGWVAEPCGWCGTGTGPLTIEPGSTSPINLGAAFHSSGIYRFVIPSRQGEDGGRFVSLPFVVKK
ncbi:MAG: hypothetical protein EA380_11365 [Phycisphaeraceae bacterium]|nr:MAG: hypothetical protein EA380_11365 [Phycisphaeraceae bacterium]